MKLSFLFFFSSIFVSSTASEVELDQAAKLFSGPVEVVFSDPRLGWLESPIWSESGEYLLFSDVSWRHPEDDIACGMLWKYNNATGNVTELLECSGLAGPPNADAIDGLPPDMKRRDSGGSNGLFWGWEDGTLLMSQHGWSRIVQMKVDDIDEATASIDPDLVTVVADSYDGARLNSPNDMCLAKDGYLYFTDPPFGLQYNDVDNPFGNSFEVMTQDAPAVYRRSKAGDLERILQFDVADEWLERAGPNGIAVNDENGDVAVVIMDWNNPRVHIYVRAEDGTYGPDPKTVLLTEYRIEEGELASFPPLVDGITYSGDLRILIVSGPGGIYVYEAYGAYQLLGFIRIDDLCSNNVIGGGYLWITCSQKVLRIPLASDEKPTEEKPTEEKPDKEASAEEKPVPSICATFDGTDAECPNNPTGRRFRADIISSPCVGYEFFFDFDTEPPGNGLGPDEPIVERYVRFVSCVDNNETKSLEITTSPDLSELEPSDPLSEGDQYFACDTASTILSNEATDLSVVDSLETQSYLVATMICEWPEGMGLFNYSDKPCTYTVRKGDTGIGIAKKLGVTFEDLKAANAGVDWNRLKVGQKLKLPVCCYYTIQKGDTGIGIAKKLDITFQELSAANAGVDWERLKIGHRLKLPGCCIYTVLKGDTGTSIAQKLGITFPELSKANPGIDWNKLQIGQELSYKSAQCKTNRKPCTDASTEDTWDDVTNRRIRELDPRVQDAAKKFINAVEEELGIKLRVSQGRRTVDEQDELYKQGRTTPGKKVTNARGGESYHNYGLAIDIVEIRDGRAIFDLDFGKVAPIGKCCGFEWGGDWKRFKDRPHFQMRFGQSIKQLIIKDYPVRALVFGYLKDTDKCRTPGN